MKNKNRTEELKRKIVLQGDVFGKKKAELKGRQEMKKEVNEILGNWALKHCDIIAKVGIERYYFLALKELNKEIEKL